MERCLDKFGLQEQIESLLLLFFTFSVAFVKLNVLVATTTTQGHPRKHRGGRSAFLSRGHWKQTSAVVVMVTHGTVVHYLITWQHFCFRRWSWKESLFFFWSKWHTHTHTDTWCVFNFRLVCQRNLWSPLLSKLHVMPRPSTWWSYKSVLKDLMLGDPQSSETASYLGFVS